MLYVCVRCVCWCAHARVCNVYARVWVPGAYIVYCLLHVQCANNFVHMKRRCLGVLLEHRVMPEAEAMRFLHGIVDMAQLAGKLKQKLPDDADRLVEEVCLFAGVGIHACMCVCTWIRVCARVCVSGGCSRGLERTCVPCATSTPTVIARSTTRCGPRSVSSLDILNEKVYPHPRDY